MINSATSKNISLFILMIAFVAFVYGTSKAIQIVDKTQVGTSDGIYISYISTSEEIQHKAFNLTTNCVDTVCKVQNLLDFTSNIPYKTNTFQQNLPQKTIQKNYGDCDDKSNLLISMLHAVGIKAYFVLVPKHIFVIVPLEGKQLAGRKGLWIKNKKYYILESTAKGSSIGFPLQYTLEKIEAIVEPFSNKKLDITHLKYKL